MALVRVGRFLNPWEAELSCALLEASGIHAQVFDRELSSLRWDLAIALGGVSLLVEEGDAERARRVLEAAPSPRPAEQEACPVCASTELEHIGPGYAWLTVSLALLVPAPAKPPRTRCLSCGHTWSPVEDGSVVESREQLEAAESAVGVGGEERSGYKLVLLFGLLLAGVALYLAYRVIKEAAA